MLFCNLKIKKEKESPTLAKNFFNEHVVNVSASCNEDLLYCKIIFGAFALFVKNSNSHDMTHDNMAGIRSTTGWRHRARGHTHLP